MTLVIGIGIIAAAVYAVLRKVEVRLALLLASLALGLVAGDLPAIIRKFFSTFASSQYIVPLCSSMGFAYVLRHTLCDQHLVQALSQPLRRARAFVVPGAVVVGFLVNIPVISQSSSAVAIGAVLIPLLLLTRVSSVTAGAALLLGASVGGELLNPGAPEYRTVIKNLSALGATPPAGTVLVQHTTPFVLLQLGVSLAVFWFLSVRAERAHAKERALIDERDEHQPAPVGFKVNPFKAAVPVLPLVLLFLVAPPLELIHIPAGWLVSAKEATDPLTSPFDSRLIGGAMMIGVIAASLTDRRAVGGVMKAFFDGAGYALTHIVSLIIGAACFGEGVKLIGIDQVIGHAVAAWPQGLIPAAGLTPMGFGIICGSGIASTESLYAFFAAPALKLGISTHTIGAVVALGSAAGRTMSPVSAVALMCASLTETDPTALVRRVGPPLVAGMLVVIAAAMLTAGGR